MALSHLLPIHDRTAKTIINASLVLASASYVSFRCFDQGQNIHWSFRIGKRINKRNFKRAETILGGLPAVIAGLILVWLLGVAIARLPFEGFSNSVSDSWVVQELVHTLPPVPAVFAEFDKEVNPNAQPSISLQPQSYPDFNYSLTGEQMAAVAAAQSVVRITSFSCGGIVSGSGFSVGQGLVATNAHVIAGSKRPIIKYNGTSYVGIPVYFNPNLDLAILSVANLNAVPLKLDAINVALNTTVAIIGYPGGNYQVIPGLIRNTLAVSSTSIYDEGSFGHGIYVLQAYISKGSSGSPVVLSNGQVAGIVFSQSTEQPDHAYALTSPNMLNAVSKSKLSSKRVGTGACTV